MIRLFYIIFFIGCSNHYVGERIIEWERVNGGIERGNYIRDCTYTKIYNNGNYEYQCSYNEVIY